MAYQTGFYTDQKSVYSPYQSTYINYTPPPPLPPSYSYYNPQPAVIPQPSVTEIAHMVTQTVRQEFQQEISHLRSDFQQSQSQLYESQQQTQQMCQELRGRIDYLTQEEDDRRRTTQSLFSLGGAFLGAALGGPVVAATTVVGAFTGSAFGYAGGTVVHDNSSGSVARKEEIQISKRYIDILERQS